MPYAIDRAPISLGFNLSRKNRCTVTRGDQKGAVWERDPGDTVLAYLPGSAGVVKIPAGERVMGVSLHFSPAVFKGLFRTSLPGFEDFLSGSGSPAHSYYRQAGSTPQTAAILSQILACPFQGDLKRLFFESKALELVVYTLAGHGNGNSENRHGLGRPDLDRVRDAFHILFSNLEDPPGLDQLGRLAGINRNKLNQGFRLVYGDTVFNVLRKLRLSKAWRLLVETDLDLAQIAFSVGYNSQSNFTTAFRRQWGRTPKTVRQEAMDPPDSFF